MNNNQQEKTLLSEEEILETEKEVLKEIKQAEKKIMGLEKRLFTAGLLIALVVAASAAGAIYWRALKGRITIDKAAVTAPRIDLAAKAAGPLEEVFVQTGDQVAANTVVARVGNELIKTKSAGLVIDVKQDIGQIFSPGMPVVSLIDPNELRIVGQIDENKGLADIAVGQPAAFTIDAFGGTRFTGVVDEINQTANDSGVVFSISDKREIKKFEIKIRYNSLAHPEFKNGMSAKIIIYKE